MAPKAKPVDPSKLVGRRVAVSFGRDTHLSVHALHVSEFQPPLRDTPENRPRTFAHADEVWLKDVAFFEGLSMVGRLLEPRSPEVTTRHGWREAGIDRGGEGRIYDLSDGASVRSAKFARVTADGIVAMGLMRGEPFRSVEELDQPRPQIPVVGPHRETWRGDMGGLNFVVAPASEVALAVEGARERWPGCVILDGSDDWYADDRVRVHDLCNAWRIVPLAWWHTGVSGVTPSGAILTAAQFDEFRGLYRRRFGIALAQDSDPGRGDGWTRPACGCYAGEGVLVV